MQEFEPGRVTQSSPVELLFDGEEQIPFKAVRTDNRWKLKINKDSLKAKGLTNDEIEGVCALEQERLVMQISLDSSSALEGLRKWQHLGKEDTQIQAFKTLFERISSLNSLERHDPEKAALARQFLTKFANMGSNLPEQLFAGILATQVGDTVLQDQLIENVINNLGQPEEIEGRLVSPLDSLTSPTLSFESKTAWFENRFLPWLQFLKARDQTEKETESTQDSNQNQQEASPKQPQLPPPASDQYEQHRGKETKGEAEPIFIIDPYLGGYYESDSFDAIDETTGRLAKTVAQSVKGQVIPVSESKDQIHQISGQTSDNLFSLPLTKDYHLTSAGLDTLRKIDIEVFADTEGHVFLKSSKNQQFQAEITHDSLQSPRGIFSQDSATAEQSLPQDIEQELEKIRSTSADSLDKAKLWRDFVHSYFKYPQDEQVEAMYQNVDSQSGNRLKAMVMDKLADCFLAREFFLSGLKRLALTDLEWRAVNGYFVKNKTKDNTAWLHSGNAHAWAKVRLHGEKDWIVLDPTPKGDPVKEGEESESSDAGNSMDDFEELSSEPLSEDQMEELQKEISEKEKKEKQISPEEQWLKEFSNKTGLPLDQVRKIKETLDQVDQMTDSQGRNILNLVKEQIDKIIQRYIKEKDREVGLVRMSQGETLEDPVAARLDLKAGVLDPTGFSRTETVTEKEEAYGGFDVHLAVDGSGSMADPLDGKIKYKEQQKMVYLMMRAIHYFAQEAEKRKLRLLTPLKVRSEVIMFQNNKAEVIKPLSEDFTLVDMAILWKRLGENIGGGTPDHLGLQAVLDNIPPQEVQLLKDKKLLKIVSLVRDGGSDNPGKVAQLSEQLRNINTIVADFLITDGSSLDKLPESIANQVIDAIRALMPQRVKRR